MPQPEGAELDAVRARREELKQRFLRPVGERPATPVGGIHHAALICRDVEATIAFYQETLGFPLVDRFGDVAAMPPELEAFLDAGEPPIVFTYGSAMRQGAGFFDTAVRLCRRMGRRGVLLAPQGGQIPKPLPAGIIHLP